MMSGTGSYNGGRIFYWALMSSFGSAEAFRRGFCVYGVRIPEEMGNEAFFDRRGVAGQGRPFCLGEQKKTTTWFNRPTERSRQ